MSRRGHRSLSSESDPGPTPAPRSGISGRVYLPDGSPANGALVALSTAEGSPDIAASTDEKGDFHLPLPGSARVTVTATAGSLHAAAPIESDEQRVVLHLKEPSHE